MRVDVLVILFAVVLGVLVRAYVNLFLPSPELASSWSILSQTTGVLTICSTGVLVWAAHRLRCAAPKADPKSMPQQVWDPLGFASNDELDGKRHRSLQVKHGCLTTLANLGLAGQRQVSPSSCTGSTCSTENQERCSESGESNPSEPTSECDAAALQPSAEPGTPQSELNEPRRECACASPTARPCLAFLGEEDRASCCGALPIEVGPGPSGDPSAVECTAAAWSFHEEMPRSNAEAEEAAAPGLQGLERQLASCTAPPELDLLAMEGKSASAEIESVQSASRKDAELIPCLPRGSQWSECLEDDLLEWDVGEAKRHCEAIPRECDAAAVEAPNVSAGSECQAGSQAYTLATRSSAALGHGPASGPLGTIAAAGPPRGLAKQAHRPGSRDDGVPAPPPTPSPSCCLPARPAACSLPPLTLELSAHITWDDEKCCHRPAPLQQAAEPVSTGASTSKKPRKSLGVPNLTISEILHSLEKVDGDRVLIVRKIKKLGFSSADTLREHFEQFGPVEDVLISHSHLQSRVRPAGLGFVVLGSEETAASALAAGKEQVVQGHVISMTLFEQLEDRVVDQ